MQNSNSKKEAIKICFLENSGKEAHFPGTESVAVCWNIKKVEKKLKAEDGLIYKAEVNERQKPESPT